jgi:hypothetical protein
MKKFQNQILFLLFILFNCSNLSARIGETLEQCKNRYGGIIEKKENTYVFNKNGFNVGVRLINNKVEFISFNKEDLAREKYFNEVEKWTEKLKAEYKEFQKKDRSITNAEWIVLFEANTKWKISDKYISSPLEDEKYTGKSGWTDGVQTSYSRKDKILKIWTKKWDENQFKSKTQKSKGKLKGF